MNRRDAEIQRGFASASSAAGNLQVLRMWNIAEYKCLSAAQKKTLRLCISAV